MEEQRRRGRPSVSEGEPSKSVGVSLPLSIVQEMDDMIGPYGSRSRFVRVAVMRYIRFKRKKRDSNYTQED